MERSDGVYVKGSYVKPICIKDKGAPGKGKKIINKNVHEGLMTQFGYNLEENATKRQNALKKAIKKYGSLKILKRIVYLRTLRKANKNSLNYRKLDSDVKFIQKLRK